MASGAALVTTDCGGVSDFVENEHNALVVPPKDSYALTQAIIRLIEDSPLRCRLGQVGASHMATMGWDDWAPRRSRCSAASPRAEGVAASKQFGQPTRVTSSLVRRWCAVSSSRRAWC